MLHIGGMGICSPLKNFKMKAQIFCLEKMRVDSLFMIKKCWQTDEVNEVITTTSMSHRCIMVSWNVLDWCLR